jgi:hypothetical protein
MNVLASLRSWPFSWMGGEGGMAINETPDKLVPVWCMGGFADPILKGSKIVNCNFRHVGKE